MASQPPGDPGVNIEPFFTELPNEIIDKILMKIKDASKLREIRLLSRACTAGATRALFSHLDVSLDEIGCMKLDCVAQSPTLRRMVKSIRFCEPRIVFSTEWVEDDSGLTRRRNNYGYMQAADGSDSGVIAKLARSLRLLPEIGEIEIDCRLGAQQRDVSDLDRRYKLWALSALEGVSLPKLKTIVIPHREESHVEKWYEADAARLNRAISRASKFVYASAIGSTTWNCTDSPPIWVRLHFDRGWVALYSDPQDLPSLNANIWRAVTGSGAEHLLDLHPNRPGLMICEKIDGLSTIQPENMFAWNGLVRVSLGGFDTSLPGLTQALFSSSTFQLHTVSLREIRIHGGSFEDLFTKLSGCESLVELKLRTLFYADDWIEDQIYHGDTNRGIRGYDPRVWPPVSKQGWDMVHSRRFRDLSACRDLIHHVDRNRIARGRRAVFPDTTPWSDDMSQAQWLAKLSPLSECSRTGRFEWDMEWDRMDPFNKVPWLHFPLQDGIMHYFLRLRVEQELIGLHDQFEETKSKLPAHLRPQSWDCNLPICTELPDETLIKIVDDDESS